MECKVVREALSAHLDGEEHTLGLDFVESHCASCMECQWWYDQVQVLHRSVRVAPAPAVPDLTPAITNALANVALPTEARQKTLQTCRVLLACCALIQLVATLPMLFGANTGPVHVDHELGSWDAALSAGLLFAAWRPARAWGMLPLVGAVAIFLGITAITDVISGATSIGAESTHLLECVGVLFLWTIARISRDESEVPFRSVQLA